MFGALPAHLINLVDPVVKELGCCTCCKLHRHHLEIQAHILAENDFHQSKQDRSEGFPARDIWFLGTLDQGSAQIPEFLGNRRRRRRRRRRLSDSQDGCPVYWFDWVTARMAVQFTGLIEWQPGWLSLLLVRLSDSQDGWFSEWVVFSISRKWKYKLPRDPSQGTFSKSYLHKINSFSW